MPKKLLPLTKSNCNLFNPIGAKPEADENVSVPFTHKAKSFSLYFKAILLKFVATIVVDVLFVEVELPDLTKILILLSVAIYPKRTIFWLNLVALWRMLPMWGCMRLGKIVLLIVLL